MPWTRSGDSAATYPALMQLQGTEGADDRLLNELFGFVWRCSCQSAAHKTDYVVDAGTAYMLGGARTEVLIRLLEQAEIFTPTTNKGARAWKILQDPDFIHIRLKAEVEWERQQRNDTRSPALVVPVRLRDGDNCRWCGILVTWRGRKTSRSGELDHLAPGEAGTVDTMVVACRGCNGSRQNNVGSWDDNHALRPPPARPNYGKHTAELLTENGHPTEANIASDGSAPALVAAADPAPTPGVRPAAPERGRQRQAPSKSPSEVEQNSLSRSVRTSSAGSGREGSVLNTSHQGSAGSTSAAHPTPSDPAHSRPRRRGKRGGRSRHPRTAGDL